MKVLSKVALGMILNRHSNNVKFLPNKEQQEFINNETLGDDTTWDSGLIENTEGSPAKVSQWMAERGFESNFTEEAQYALAALLHIKTEFMSPARQEIIVREVPVLITPVSTGGGDAPCSTPVEGTCVQAYKRAIHDNATETYNDKDIFELGLFGEKVIKENKYKFHGESDTYEAKESHKNLRMFISEKDVTPEELKEANKKPDSNPKQDELGYISPFPRKGLDLHVPFAEATVSESVDELIGMEALVSGEEMEVGNCDLETRFTLDNKGAEVKQMASMSMVCTGSLGSFETPPRRVVEIDKEFFVYITYNDSLMVALKIEPEDFIKA